MLVGRIKTCSGLSPVIVWPRVMRVENSGDVWIDFGNFRARAQIQLPVVPDQVLQLKVVSTGEPLHLQVIWPSDASRQFAPVQIHHAGVLNQADQQRFMELIDRLLAEINPAYGSSERSRASGQANQTAGQATSDQAPKVVAKGRGLIADKIIELARRNQVPVVADPNLVHMLDALEIDTQVPPEMYQAVVEVLVFVYQINRQKCKS